MEQEIKTAKEMVDLITSLPAFDSMTNPPEHVERILIELGVDWAVLDAPSRKAIVLLIMSAFAVGDSDDVIENIERGVMQDYTSDETCRVINATVKAFMVGWHLGSAAKGNPLPV